MKHEGLGQPEQALSIPRAGEIHLCCPQGFKPLSFGVGFGRSDLRPPRPAPNPETRRRVVASAALRLPELGWVWFGFFFLFLGEEK